jgi:hypothetical protein
LISRNVLSGVEGWQAPTQILLTDYLCAMCFPAARQAYRRDALSRARCALERKCPGVYTVAVCGFVVYAWRKAPRVGIRGGAKG